MSRLRLILDLLKRPQRYRYGEARSQRVDLFQPDPPGPHPVAILIHGGGWEARYGKSLMRGLAGDLTRRGWAVWNIEYRRVGRGQGGGWPATFEDVATAVDLLDRVDAPLDLSRVVVIGHSAGGQLALWAASRVHLPAGAPGADPRVRIGAVVSQAGVNDLSGAYRASADGGLVALLMGGGPDELPERYALGDPARLVPLDIPVLLVHGSDDETVSVQRSRDYATLARAAGGSVELVELAGKAGVHHAHIDPDGQAWATVVAWLATLSDNAPGSCLQRSPGER
jgi:acetyl esterase/lipase